MLFTFIGGPLDGQQLKVYDTELKEGKYRHIEWGDYESEFHILPKMTLHEYLPVGKEMLWVEPEEIVK